MYNDFNNNQLMTLVKLNLIPLTVNSVLHFVLSERIVSDEQINRARHIHDTYII